jgi:hypothetical protein
MLLSRTRGGALVNQRHGRRGWFMFASLLFVFALVAAYNNVPTDLTSEDQALFVQLHLPKVATAPTFEQEVAQIHAIQKLLFLRAPFGPGIPKRQAREPTDLLAYGQGLCYDRSRALEKAMSFVGYKVRHVYLLYKGDKTLLVAAVHRGQHSHAVTEVRTSHGWMLVDSIKPWVAVTRDGHPVGAKDVWRRAKEFDDLPGYLEVPYWSIPGLYSRHGQFYAPFNAIPDVNWFDFLTSGLM